MPDSLWLNIVAVSMVVVPVFIAWGLGALAEVLDLSDPEKNALAQGLAFEERVAVD
jgi:hypothetical protein